MILRERKFRSGDPTSNTAKSGVVDNSFGRIFRSAGTGKSIWEYCTNLKG